MFVGIRNGRYGHFGLIGRYGRRQGGCLPLEERLTANGDTLVRSQKVGDRRE